MKHRYLRAGAFSCAAAMLIATGAQALSVEEAREILQRSYVDKLPNAAKEAETLDELFSYTDDYTYYMTGEEYEAFLSEVEGEVSFVGIGAEITYGETGITIVSVLKGGGAEKAGLLAGDVIVAIDGEGCVPGTAEAREKLLGEAGTQVRVTVLRADGSKKDITVTRALVVQANTSVSAEGGVGYIDCDSFGSQTGTYFQDGVRKNNSAVRAWIVDLRGNGGGLTSAAVTALGTFAGKGELAYFVDRDGDAIPERYAGADLTDKPAIVLMNAGSASASEIFAGGILGTGSGIVIGERSYGKGVAQIVYDGTNCPYLTDDAVKVTAYRFYCAGGNTTDRGGCGAACGREAGGRQRVPAPGAERAGLLCGYRRGEAADAGAGRHPARARTRYRALLGRKRCRGACHERTGARKVRQGGHEHGLFRRFRQRV